MEEYLLKCQNAAVGKTIQSVEPRDNYKYWEITMTDGSHIVFEPAWDGVCMQVGQAA